MNDDDRNFEIDLAQIGMRYGAFFTLGAAIFAIGGTLLLTIDKEILPAQMFVGITFLVFGFIITTQSSFWKGKKISELKRTYMKEPENKPNVIFVYKDYLKSLLYCKGYDGTSQS